MVILELAGTPPVIGGSNRSFLFLFHFTWHIKVNGWNAKPCVSCSQARYRPLYFSWSLWALGKCHKPPSLHSRQMAEPPPGTSAWIPDPQDREHNTWLWWATKFEFVSVSIKSRNEPWEPQETRPHISKRQFYLASSPGSTCLCASQNTSGLSVLIGWLLWSFKVSLGLTM